MKEWEKIILNRKYIQSLGSTPKRICRKFSFFLFFLKFLLIVTRREMAIYQHIGKKHCYHFGGGLSFSFSRWRRYQWKIHFPRLDGWTLTTCLHTSSSRTENILCNAMKPFSEGSMHDITSVYSSECKCDFCDFPFLRPTGTRVSTINLDSVDQWRMQLNGETVYIRITSGGTFDLSFCLPSFLHLLRNLSSFLFAFSLQFPIPCNRKLEYFVISPRREFIPIDLT